MNNLLRGLIAGYGAKKLGGGCFSTVLVFVILWMLLGQCGAWTPPAGAPSPADAASPAVVQAGEAFAGPATRLALP